MKKSLLGKTVFVRLKDHFDRKRRPSCHRVNIQKDPIVDPVEFHRLPGRRIDDLWLPHHRNRLPTDHLQIVQMPYHLLLRTHTHTPVHGNQK